MGINFNTNKPDLNVAAGKKPGELGGADTAKISTETQPRDKVKVKYPSVNNAGKDITIVESQDKNGNVIWRETVFVDSNGESHTGKRSYLDSMPPSTKNGLITPDANNILEVQAKAKLPNTKRI